ncbi:MAG TPA: hypothetical protein VJN21_05890 [Candidatus Acidoferrales bacterium]|nr:hypothetical protein [Candidatus Acidoferrales bacterium]
MNKIYLTNSYMCSVTVVDGATGHVSKIRAGCDWIDVNVNPVTNQIYTDDPETVTVINGATNKAREIPLPIASGIQRNNDCAPSHPAH